MFGPTTDSRSPEDWVETEWAEAGPPLHWIREIGLGYSGPVISQGRLVLLHRIGEWELATCCDSETGEALWETVWPTAYRCEYPMYSSGPYCTPIVDGERVFLLGAEARLVCLSLQDGSRLWMRDLAADYEPRQLAFGFGATPLLEDDRLIINLGGRKQNSGIIAVDKSTGETLWTCSEEISSYCTPLVTTIGGRRLVFILAQTNLVCLDPVDGHILWTEPFGVRHGIERVNAVSPLLIGRNRILVTSGPGPGAMLIEAAADGTHQVLWRTRRQGLESQYTNLLLADGTVLGFSPLKSSEWRCVDLDTGDVVWAWHKNHELRRAMSVQAGKFVIALDEDGRLSSFAPTREGPQLVSWVAEPVLEAPCFTPPVLSHGLLYLRNERELKCLSLRPEAGPVTDSPTATADLTSND